MQPALLWRVLPILGLGFSARWVDMHGPRLAPRTVSLIQEMIRVTGRVSDGCVPCRLLVSCCLMERDAAIATRSKPTKPS